MICTKMNLVWHVYSSYFCEVYTADLSLSCVTVQRDDVLVLDVMHDEKSWWNRQDGVSSQLTRD